MTTATHAPLTADEVEVARLARHTANDLMAKRITTDEARAVYRQLRLACGDARWERIKFVALG